MDDREERVRKRAYQLWEQEGCPPGRELDHWDKASELVAIEENHKLATIPVRQSGAVGPTGEPIEPISAVENAGEFPTLTDQGEEQTAPKRRNRTVTAAPRPATKKSPRSKAPRSKSGK
jgi:hypothetical protein